MARVNGVPGYTQTDLLNITNQLLVKGIPVATETGSQAENVVVVNELSDLPTPSGGKYTLAANTVYDFSAKNGLLVADSFDVSAGGIVIKAETALYVMITYLGTNPLFEGANLDIRNITIAAPNAEIYSLTKTGSADYFLTNTVLIAVAAKYGTFDLHDILLINCGSIDLADGLTINGAAWNTMRIDGFNLMSTSATFTGLDFGSSVLSGARIDSCVMTAPSGAVGVSGLASSANVTPGEIATFTNGGFDGGMAELSGITASDIRWIFDNNAGVPDSLIAGNPYLSTTTTVTIAVINTFVKINQGNWLSTVSERLSITVDGDVVNNTEDDITIDFNGFVTMEKVGGGSDFIVARLVYDDDPAHASSIITENGTDNAGPTSVPLVGIFTLPAGIGVSIYVANTSSTSNITITNSKFTNFRLR